MSRDIRRVPVDYKHPVEPNPHWTSHLDWRLREGYGYPKLHKPEERFVSLFEYSSYLLSLQEEAEERESFTQRKGSRWDFCVEYHLTGFQGYQDRSPVVHPFHRVDETGEDETIEVRDEDHLQELLLEQLEQEKTEYDPDYYMPSFEEYKEEDLGWCLYQTVSEGTPVTPVFKTPEELIEHLVEFGTEDDPPLRRASAENIVNRGGTMGSFFVKDGEFLNSTKDADKI